MPPPAMTLLRGVSWPRAALASSIITVHSLRLLARWLSWAELPRISVMGDMSCRACRAY